MERFFQGGQGDERSDHADGADRQRTGLQAQVLAEQLEQEA